MFLTEEKKEALKKAGVRFPVVAESCIGCGACVAVAPDVFDLDEEGMSVVKDMTSYEGKGVEDSISACPVDAISWKE